MGFSRASKDLLMHYAKHDLSEYVPKKRKEVQIEVVKTPVELSQPEIMRRTLEKVKQNDYKGSFNVTKNK